VLAEGEGFEPPVRFPVQRFSRCTFLAVLTWIKALTVGRATSETGSEPLIRQLLCSALCSKFSSRDGPFPRVPLIFGLASAVLSMLPCQSERIRALSVVFPSYPLRPSGSETPDLRCSSSIADLSVISSPSF
jgi:hypothetical protein